MKPLIPSSISKNARKYFFIFFALGCLCLFNIVAAQPTLSFNRIIQGLDSSNDIKNAGDNSHRLFIVEQRGTIRIYKNGNLLNAPFLDVHNLVRFSGEAGLLSIVFHPDYKSNGFFFIYYTAKNKSIVLARYKVSATNADSADASSGVILFSLSRSGGVAVHNGGNLSFGKDGYLYVSIGYGGNNGDALNSAQNGQSLFGKILRLNASLGDSPPYYTIPPDNPFVNDPNVLDEIWALGLRNPWRWSLDRLTNDMWIGDVGESSREEVDFRKRSKSAGANYGWRCYEGTIPFNTDSCKGIRKYVAPVFDYDHQSSSGGNCIIGGYVYRGTAFPQLQGYYICADFVSRNLWKIKPDGLGGWNISSQNNAPKKTCTFGEDEDGELYLATITGDVYQVVVNGSFAQSSPKKLFPIK